MADSSGPEGLIVFVLSDGQTPLIEGNSSDSHGAMIESASPMDDGNLPPTKDSTIDYFVCHICWYK